MSVNSNSNIMQEREYLANEYSLPNAPSLRPNHHHHSPSPLMLKPKVQRAATTALDNLSAAQKPGIRKAKVLKGLVHLSLVAGWILTLIDAIYVSVESRSGTFNYNYSGGWRIFKISAVTFAELAAVFCFLLNNEEEKKKEEERKITEDQKEQKDLNEFVYTTMHFQRECASRMQPHFMPSENDLKAEVNKCMQAFDRLPESYKLQLPKRERWVAYWLLKLPASHPNRKAYEAMQRFARKKEMHDAKPLPPFIQELKAQKMALTKAEKFFLNPSVQTVGSLITLIGAFVTFGDNLSDISLQISTSPVTPPIADLKVSMVVLSAVIGIIWYKARNITERAKEKEAALRLQEKRVQKLEFLLTELHELSLYADLNSYKPIRKPAGRDPLPRDISEEDLKIQPNEEVEEKEASFSENFCFTEKFFDTEFPYVYVSNERGIDKSGNPLLLLESSDDSEETVIEVKRHE